MTGRRAALPDSAASPALVPSEVPVGMPVGMPEQGREGLAVVRTLRPAVFRTFAEDSQSQRSGPLWRRVRRRIPAGPVHAAGLQGEDALCGRSLETLHEFGRSRFAFERFEETRRCPACDVAAGRPTA